MGDLGSLHKASELDNLRDFDAFPQVDISKKHLIWKIREKLMPHPKEGHRKKYQKINHSSSIVLVSFINIT